MAAITDSRRVPDTSIVSAKADLRRELLSLRASLGEKDVLASDEAVRGNVLSLPEYRSAHTLFVYVSMPGEVDTRHIIADSLHLGKRVCVPRCTAKGQMDACEIKSTDDLVPGKYDIPEPAPHCGIVHQAEIDLALLPCVSCDPEGYRLGYGGGYYDRYLAGKDIVKAVLIREALMVDGVPHEVHDIRADMIGTDEAIYGYTASLRA
jgi:5-formyltetrahydrofolate cyclo-ligase